MPSGAVVVFTRDLRVTDHPALAQAVRGHDVVVPLFVFDDTILAGAFNRPNRTGFLLESLADLDAALRSLGGRLVTRRGDWVDRVLRVANDVGAAAVHVSDDAERVRAELGSHGSRPRPVPPASTSTGHRGWPSSSPVWSHPATRATTTRCSRGTTGAGPTSGGARWWPPRRASTSRPTWTPARSPSSPTSSRATARLTSCPGAPGPPTGSSTPGSSGPSAPTPTVTTTSPATRPPGSRRTCTSGACHRSRWRAPPAGTKAPTRSCGSSVGATSTCRSSPPAPTPRGRTTSPAATAGATIPTGCAPGRRAAPGTRSSTPRCGSCDRKGGCTTGPGSSWRPSSPRTSTSTGAPAPVTSSTSCSTATSPTTTSTGSGWPARAPTPTRTACSTRRCRAPGSTPRVSTCGATCPSYAR